MENTTIIKSVELETVCGITSTFPENENIEITRESDEAPNEEELLIEKVDDDYLRQELYLYLQSLQ